MEGTYYITTPIGTFRVVKSARTEVRREIKRVFSTLQIGDQHDAFIELKWDDNEDTVELYWLEIEKGWCNFADIDPLLLYISITLLRKYHHNVKTLWFLDNSSIKCTLPLQENQTTPIIQSISLPHLYFLTKQSTWYEAKFGAYPFGEQEHLTYMKYKEHFRDPAKKPLFFDFCNDDLRKYFNPIYESTDTWADFIKAIGEQPCNRFLPWYINAVSEIVERRTLIPHYWKIDINENTPTVTIDIYTGRGYGSRKTIKNSRSSEKHIEYPTLSPFRLSEIRYPSLL